MTEAQVQELIRVLSDNSMEWWGIATNIVTIIVSVGIAIYSVKSAYKDNLWQIKQDRRLNLYADIAYTLGSLKVLKKLPFDINNQKLTELQGLQKKAQILASNTISSKFDEIIFTIESAVEQQILQQKLELSDTVLTIKIETLQIAMKWEKDNNLDISTKAYQELLGDTTKNLDGKIGIADV